jgi:L-amino acid N-acyltransferase YncA
MLRPAREEDLPRIVEIYNSTIPSRQATADLEPVTVEQRLGWFRAHHAHRPILVSENADTITAWLSFEDFYGRAAYAGTSELSLYVAPESRRRGLGRQLLGAALEMAPDLGIHAVVAYVFAHNTPSLRLLDEAGFGRWGCLERVARMDGRDYDLLILGKHMDGNAAVDRARLTP